MRLADIREAVAERVATVTGVRAVAHAPDQIPAGAASVVIVTPGSPYIDYHEAFAGGLAVVNLTLSPWVQLGEPRAAMARLDDLLSSGAGASSSLIDALMGSDRTLGGVCADLVVDDASNVRGEQSVDGARYLICDLSLRVLVRRT